MKWNMFRDSVLIPVWFLPLCKVQIAGNGQTYIRVANCQTVRMKEEKEVLEHFAGVFTMMNPLTFKEIFQTTVPYMVERISKNYALQVWLTLLSYVLSTCVKYLVSLLFPSNMPKDSACRAEFIENCSFQSLSRVRLFASPWTAAHEASPSLHKHMSIESGMPPNQLILCRPLLLLPSILSSIKVFSSESVLHIMWPKYLNFSISPSNEYSGLIL